MGYFGLKLKSIYLSVLPVLYGLRRMARHPIRMQMCPLLTHEDPTDLTDRRLRPRMSPQAKKVRVWQARASRYALRVCRCTCGGALQRQTSCQQTRKACDGGAAPAAWRSGTSGRSLLFSLIRMPGRAQSASAFLNPTRILPAGIAGETARVRQDACACVRGACARASIQNQSDAPRLDGKL